MRNLFDNSETDVLTHDEKVCVSYSGHIHHCMKYIEDFGLSDATLWKRFVQQFVVRTDTEDDGWRGEFWGKMMRGACFVYSYTKNETLYDCLCRTVVDMMNTMDDDGRISSYEIGHELTGWDMWSRKYVLLGMQYFIEICSDETMIEKIVASMCRQVDYLISKIGAKTEGKIPITETSNVWRGLNSTSILEPIVRLYRLTQERKYLDFAEYIINAGGTSIVNIFRLAYEDKLCPYQYPITKAYEMISCFDGLLEYYKVTKTPWHKTAIINFADKMLESDFTIIGGSGCTHELFDHSTVRQANTTNMRTMQETCVTVTLMKFFYRLNQLTGDSKYVDAFEISLYNAYFGAVNTEKSIDSIISKEYPEAIVEPLPFDSYSPLVAGTRGNGIGGLKLMSDNHYYGCCACIGSMGIGLVPKIGFLKNEGGFTFNLFVAGEYKTLLNNNVPVTFKVETDYPKNGKVKIKISLEEEQEFTVSVRNPAWSENTIVTVNDNPVRVSQGYVSINKKWNSNDTISIDLDMGIKLIKPIPYGHDILMNQILFEYDYVVSRYDEEDQEAKKHIAFRHGPITLAMDNRLGKSVDESIGIDTDNICAELLDEKQAPYPCMLLVKISDKSNKQVLLTDYASVGKLWNEESKMAAWLKNG